MAYHVYKNNTRRKTRSGATFSTPSAAWAAIYSDLPMPYKGWTIEQLKLANYVVKLAPPPTHLFSATVNQYMTLVRATDEDAARRSLRRANGTLASITAVRIATSEDISWFQAMGGKLP